MLFRLLAIICACAIAQPLVTADDPSQKVSPGLEAAITALDSIGTSMPSLDTKHGTLALEGKFVNLDNANGVEKGIATSMFLAADGTIIRFYGSRFSRTQTKAETLETMRRAFDLRNFLAPKP